MGVKRFLPIYIFCFLFFQDFNPAISFSSSKIQLILYYVKPTFVYDLENQSDFNDSTLFKNFFFITGFNVQRLQKKYFLDIQCKAFSILYMALILYMKLPTLLKLKASLIRNAKVEICVWFCVNVSYFINCVLFLLWFMKREKQRTVHKLRHL